MISFHIRSSPALCQSSSRDAMSIAWLIAAEAHALYRVFVCGALACQVSPVRLPLPASLVVQVSHPDSATLQVRTRASPFSAEGAAVAGFSRAAGVVHEQLESARPCNAFVRRTTRLWWPQPDFPLVVSSCHVSPDPSGAARASPDMLRPAALISRWYRSLARATAWGCASIDGSGRHVRTVLTKVSSKAWSACWLRTMRTLSRDMRFKSSRNRVFGFRSARAGRSIRSGLPPG